MSTSKATRAKRVRRKSIIEAEPKSENDDMNSDLKNSGESDSDSECDSEDLDNEENNWLTNVTEMMPTTSYSKLLEEYTDEQTKLAPSHIYVWCDGEKLVDEPAINEFLLPESTKQLIRTASFTQMFEYFFSTEIKKYIIECTNHNGYELSVNDLNIFVGIVIMSIVNSRTSQRDYWSEDPLLACYPVAKVMSRNKFMKIKSCMKLSKPSNKSSTDKAWRVRGPLEIFRKNIKQFGFFSTSLSVDESMIKFYGRTALKQYIKDKPTKWGVKQWSLCNPDINVSLNKCALGSRVVLQMLQGLLASVTAPKKIIRYHVYFDNYFCSPDLLVHLKKIGIRATGTVQANRVKDVDNGLNKKSPRGTYRVKSDKNSGINYITIMDSKPVSLLSTAAGVTPLSTMRRFSKEQKGKTELPFPNAFMLYNKNMGGIDQHDFFCSNLMPSIRSKKWTWVIFLRFIQASLANATVLKNMVRIEEKKV